MNISQEHVAYKRKIGSLKGVPVMELATKGGLHMIIIAKAAGFETLAASPHRAMSKYMAEKKEPELVWSDLQKGDHVDPANFQLLIPAYEALTERIRKLQGE